MSLRRIRKLKGSLIGVSFVGEAKGQEMELDLKEAEGFNFNLRI